METYTKIQLINKMTNFWKENVNKMYDYPSLDITFGDNSVLKFHIQPREYMGMAIPVAIITYTDDESARESNPFPPSLTNKLTLRGFIANILNQMGVEKPVRKIYENLC